MTTAQQKTILHEDWTVVLLGFGIIVLALAGIKPVSPVYNWITPADLTSNVFSGGNLLQIGILFAFVYLIALAGTWLTGRSVGSMLVGFPIIYFITTVAVILAGNKEIKSLNLEAVIFSLLIGLLIGNLFQLPEWFRKALSTELFVKIGLVILGTTVIFSDILKAGAYGLIQSLIVVISVWYFAFWICRLLKVDKELTMMISSAVSICGVSAAIATAGAIKGDAKKLSYVISLVLVTAIPMIIGMPYLARYLGLTQEVTGAWLGGTIDTTGAVVAAGKLAGETAVQISTIVKFSQNVLLGIAAFAISVYWVYSGSKEAKDNKQPTLRVIWERFPKFVIGFIAASLLFSFLIPNGLITEVKEPLKNIQGLWFALAFTSIGLETNFADLFRNDNRKPLYGFLIAQVFNIILTLLIAWLLFS